MRAGAYAVTSVKPFRAVSRRCPSATTDSGHSVPAIADGARVFVTTRIGATPVSAVDDLGTHAGHQVQPRHDEPADEISDRHRPRSWPSRYRSASRIIWRACGFRSCS